MFKRGKTVDVAPINWRADAAVTKLTGLVRDLEVAEREARGRAETAGTIALSVTEIEDLRTLVENGREDPDRLESARAARARAVLATDDHRKAQTALDAANVELATATAAARSRALEAIRTVGLAELDNLAAHLTAVGETKARLQEIVRTAESAFTYDELVQVNPFGLDQPGLSALTTPFPELVLGSADHTNPSDLQIWLDRRPRAVAAGGRGE